MRCSKARRLISDYLDHSLNSKKVSALEHHLQKCSECEAVLKDFEKIIEESQKLESFSPSAEMWTEIKASLKTEAQTTKAQKSFKIRGVQGFFPPPRLKYALASSFILVAMVVSLLTFGLKYWQVKPPVDSPRYAISKLEEAEHHYQLAIKALVEAVASEGEKLSPQLIQLFKENLEAVDTVINVCRQTVLQEPDNIEVRNYLLEAYGKKVDLLERMIALRPETSLQINSNPSL